MHTPTLPLAYAQETQPTFYTPKMHKVHPVHTNSLPPIYMHTHTSNNPLYQYTCMSQTQSAHPDKRTHPLDLTHMYHIAQGKVNHPTTLTLHPKLTLLVFPTHYTCDIENILSSFLQHTHAQLHMHI